MTRTGAQVQEAMAALAAARQVPVPASEWVADAIRVQVAEAWLTVGTRLPEQDLVKALGVSRNTLREALSQLVSERLLVRVPNVGVFVAKPGPDDVHDVYAARLVIEPGAVRHGARAADEELLAAVDGAYREGLAASAAGDWDGVAAANQHFHRAVAALSGSPRLEREMARLLAEMRLVFQRMPGVRGFHEPYLARNGEIAGLLLDGRVGRAADELAGYLVTARDQLLAAYADLP